MSDLLRIRELAKETLEYATCDEMQRRRALWTNHNSLSFTRPPIYIRAIPWEEWPEVYRLQCQDPYLRSIEEQLLLNRYCMSIGQDDTIIEPFLTVQAAVAEAPEGIYGVPAELEEKVGAIKAARYSPVLVEEEDVNKLHVLDYQVDEQETARRRERMADALDGILDVAVDRQAPLCRMWKNDIATALAMLRGLEPLMWDFYDNPEWLHSLIGWMQSKILAHVDQTEKAGGFRLCNHQNQAMPYCKELQPPSASDTPVSTKQLWGYMAAQEFTTVGPAMFEEFMFRYQKPILERYGLAAYGCCEDLSQKIPIIKQLKNLRRIAVSPFADPAKCAEQIGSDYVLSWRPNPSAACSRGVDEEAVRKELRRVMDIFDANGCIWDITLKDLETTSGDPTAIPRWTAIIRQELEQHYG